MKFSAFFLTPFVLLGLLLVGSYETDWTRAQPNLHPAVSPNGYLDWANCDGAGGWVWDGSNPGTRLTVELLANGSPVAGTETLADQYRADLQQAGIGDGRYGYRLTIPSVLRNNQAYTLTVRVKNSTTVLSGSFGIQCTGCTPPSLSLGTPACTGSSTYAVGFTAQSGASVTASAGQVQGSQVTGIPVGTNVTVTATLNNCSAQQSATSPASCGSPTAYGGHADWGNCDGVGGWAWDANRPTTPITVELLANGSPVAGTETLADQYRADLQQAGIGDGRHGYRINLPTSLRNNQAYTLTVRIKNSTTVLNGSFNVQCAGCTPPSLSLGTPACTGSSTYAVGFTAQSGASVTTSAGQVQGSQVTGIPVGTNVTVTATLNNCSAQQSATSPTCTGYSLTVNNLTGLQNVANTGGTGSFSVASNVSWTVSGAPGWVTVSPASGSNNGTVSVAFAANPNGARAATLTVSGSNGVASQSVALSQLGTGPVDWPVPSNQPWPAEDLIFLENSEVKVGFRKSVGGCISHVSSKFGLRGNQNLINDNKVRDPQTQQLISDKGRQVQYSSYAEPVPYTENNKTAPIGWNGVQGGNSYPYLQASPVLHYGRYTDPARGEVLYTKTQPYQWDLQDVLTKSYVEQWTWLEGRAVRMHARLTVFRDDPYRFFGYNSSINKFVGEGRQQEFPCVYTIAPLRRYWVYQGTAPYTNGGLTEVPLFGPDVSPTNPVAQKDAPFLVTSEPWIASVDDNGQGLGLYVPNASKFDAKAFGSPGGDENTNESSYVNNAVFELLDNGTFEYDAALYVGSLSEIRNWVYQQPQPSYAPNFVFSGSRRGFYYHAAHDQGWPIVDELDIRFGGYTSANGERSYPGLKSPYGIWKASQARKLYVRAAVSGFAQPQPQLALEYIRAGQIQGLDSSLPNERQAPYNQIPTFTVISDGQYRTYEIDLTNVGDWRDIIAEFTIMLPRPFPTLTGNERLKVKWISTSPSGPAGARQSADQAAGPASRTPDPAGMHVRVLGNPVTDQLRVQVEGVRGQALDIQVVDGRGQVLQQRRVVAARDLEQQDFDVRRHPAGVLLFQVTSPQQRQTVKIIKQ